MTGPAIGNNNVEPGGITFYGGVRWGWGNTATAVVAPEPSLAVLLLRSRARSDARRTLIDLAREKGGRLSPPALVHCSSLRLVARAAAASASAALAILGFVHLHVAATEVGAVERANGS